LNRKPTPTISHPTLTHTSFITPSIFQSHSTPDWPVIDEWTLCEKLGRQRCYDTLKPHWDTFVSLQDFQKIRDAGLNIVRIPVGYWSYVNPWGPYTQGGRNLSRQSHHVGTQDGAQSHHRPARCAEEPERLRPQRTEASESTMG
jgi:hypothetical protein